MRALGRGAGQVVGIHAADTSCPGFIRHDVNRVEVILLLRSQTLCQRHIVTISISQFFELVRALFDKIKRIGKGLNQAEQGFRGEMQVFQAGAVSVVVDAFSELLQYGPLLITQIKGCGNIPSEGSQVVAESACRTPQGELAFQVLVDQRAGANLRAGIDVGLQILVLGNFAGEIPQHQNLQAHIDTSPEVCTSALVNKHLEGKFALWGAAGAFGDNLAALARDIAASFNLSDEQWSVLQQLGECINYNAYGTSLEDLHFTPEALFRLIQPFANPFDFVEQCPDQFKKLTDGYRDDMALAQRLRAEQQDDLHAVYIMPDEAWARRVSGVYANDLASASPQRAHAILTKRPAGGYVVSVRAPLANKEGADELCRRFPTGGGRKAAAGINNLPDDMVLDFFRQFKLAYSKK